MTSSQTPEPARPTPPPLSRTPALTSDCAYGDDLLGISDDARSIANLIAMQNLSAPLSIAVFGNWGAGKTFFINEVKKQVDGIQNNIKTIQSKEDKGTVEQKYLNFFCGHIIQIEFNAWHYVDTNLYASLASHIFEQCDNGMKGQSPHDAAVKGIMLDALLEERERQKGVLQQRQKEAEVLHRKAHDNKKEVLDKVKETEEYKALQANEKLFKTIEPHLNNANDADEIIRKANSLPQRTKLFFKQISKKSLFIATTILGITLVFILLAFIVEKYKLHISIGASISAAVSFIWAWVKKNNIYNIRMKVKEFTNIVTLLAEKQKALTSKKEKAAALELELKEREKAIEELDNKIEKIKMGDYISQLIEGRNSSNLYKKHLGLVSVLRQDFQLLSDYVTRKQAGERTIDRIVLYIDDLDRCPAKDVVEVLKAIHLLLSFNIFVVIVAVDVRWVTKCLAEHYKAIFHESDGASSTSAYDYLEKVFQLAIKIQPITSQQAEVYIRQLLRKDLLHEMQEMAGITCMKKAAELAAAAKEDAGELPAHMAVDIESLVVLKEDIEDVIKFVEVLGTSPRTIKRAINIYRLIKADKNDYENILILLLLSIMIKLPKMAADIFRQIMLSGEDGTVSGVLSRVNKKEQEFEVFEAFLSKNEEMAGIRTFLLKPLIPVVSRYSFYLDEL